MAITDPYVLPQDLLIVPVTELEPSILALIEHQEGDFAINRPRSRTPPKIVDGVMGSLLKTFSAPRPIVDAVLEFGDARGVDPQQLLVDAFPVLQRFINAGLLVEAGSRHERSILAELEEGYRIGDWQVVHCLQVLEDVELYQVKNDDGRVAALKIARDDSRSTRRMLEHEATVLERAGGAIAPRLQTTGLEKDRTYFIMEWRHGVSAGVAADELRAGASDGRRLLRLCADIAEAYAELHERGIVHGDVHDRNLLIDASGRVTIVDFGLARVLAPEHTHTPHRGGVGFFFDPEYATAVRDKRSPDPVTDSGEQYSVAALLYWLFAGAHYLNFSSDRNEALRQIAEEPSLAFVSRGISPFPLLEKALGKALQKSPTERWKSTRELAEALRAIEAADRSVSDAAAPFSIHGDRSREIIGATLQQFAPGGSIFETGIPAAPTANVNFGAAGVAFYLYRVALAREDASLLSLADIWVTRAQRTVGSPTAFYNRHMGLLRRTVGPTSLYHTESGIHVTRALIARAMSDFVTMSSAIDSFIAVSRRRGAQIDLTLGRAGILLGCALLLEADPRSPLVDVSVLSQFGDRIAREMWAQLDEYPRIGAPSPMDSLGIAHGWAGMLYATLRWRAARRQPIEEVVRERLDQLANVAEPEGRGLRWRWIDNGGGESRPHGYMGGWCNGSAGFVHLWQAAAATLGDPRFLDLASGAAWNAWEDSEDDFEDLCCGLAGRAYSFLTLYRATGDAAWHQRATALAQRAGHVGDDDAFGWVSTCTSLYKSGLGAVLLLADLERPESARMPLFEAEGWPVAS